MSVKKGYVKSKEAMGEIKIGFMEGQGGGAR